ncbi:MAG: histidinol-phosphate transaminase [Odoribacteraceae bacterium]|jgi:histidinol-phosphate aminotransferase|nr:histidinol-phosphate transaminase [Odoribacteraceae bacterium]
MNAEGIIRENIRSLVAYTSAREEFSGQDVTLLDANENPYDTGYNRYPDPFQRELKRAVARVKRVDAARLVLGNGSDELIDMLVRVTCEPGRDNMIVFSPSYAMYEVCGHVNGVETRSLDLDANFEPRWDALPGAIDGHTRLVFLCSPNNPTGNRWPLERVRELAGRFDGWIVVDEAYMDFATGGEPSGDPLSAVSLLEEYPRVVVLQTLSKAWGMAGLRVGICIADPALVTYLNRVKPPYNINSLTQRAAIEALADEETFRRRVREIVRERERLYRAFARVPFFEAVYPSEANFLLTRCAAYRELYDYLVANGVIVRVRHVPPFLEDGLRFTVGTPGENDRLIQLLEQWTRP